MAMLDGTPRYDMSILKSADASGSACNRFTFRYAALPGVGHFLHTYACDGSPIPSFTGEPEPVAMTDSLDELAQKIWGSLNEQNKVSLYVSETDLATGVSAERIINKHA